jgi:HSP20 family protein
MNNSNKENIMSHSTKNSYLGFMTNSYKDFFERLPHFSKKGQKCYYIHLNLYEDYLAYHIEADLPGVNESDANVELDDDRLTISAKRVRLSNIEKYSLEECYCGNFERTITLPSKVDSNQVYANYKNGVLHVSINKLVKSIPAKKIKINCETVADIF